mmetsp:Transcript_28909/g.74289  ORF Transcript_28909/g.74289 Transcript_28909/m.74289 type:complete len:439 (+) Transcript_28909:122-1438(+)
MLTRSGRPESQVTSHVSQLSLTIDGHSVVHASCFLFAPTREHLSIWRPQGRARTPMTWQGCTRAKRRRPGGSCDATRALSPHLRPPVTRPRMLPRFESATLGDAVMVISDLRRSSSFCSSRARPVTFLASSWSAFFFFFFFSASSLDTLRMNLSPPPPPFLDSAIHLGSISGCLTEYGSKSSSSGTSALASPSSSDSSSTSSAPLAAPPSAGVPASAPSSAASSSVSSSSAGAGGGSYSRQTRMVRSHEAVRYWPFRGTWTTQRTASACPRCCCTISGSRGNFESPASTGLRNRGFGSYTRTALSIVATRIMPRASQVSAVMATSPGGRISPTCTHSALHSRTDWSSEPLTHTECVPFHRTCDTSASCPRSTPQTALPLRPSGTDISRGASKSSSAALPPIGCGVGSVSRSKSHTFTPWSADAVAICLSSGATAAARM